MPDNLIPAFIALAGVPLSIVSSLIISIRQTRIETQKFRNEYLHRYSGKLFEKRLEAYPELIKHLVEFLHKINLQSIQVYDIKNLFPILLNWDSENAIYLSFKTQNLMHKTYHLFFQLHESGEENLNELIMDKDALSNLRKKIFEFYLALKNDLGIYSLKPPSEIIEFKPPEDIPGFEKFLNENGQ
jgi:hypothetical protein